MKSTHVCPAAPIILALVLQGVLASGTPGQPILLSGNVFDGQGGPLAPNTVYRANGSLIVPAGQTLTAGAGAVVKFTVGTTMAIHGTFLVNGTGPSPVIFTSLEDDSAGGDTNNNGPSTGTPGDWHGLQFTSASDASSLTRAEVRFAGRNGFPGIGLSAADITLVACVVRDGQNSGLDLAGNVLSFPAVSGCSFVNNAGVAVDDVALETVPGFTNNAAGGNGGNYMRVTIASLGASANFGPTNLIGGSLVIQAGMVIPAGLSLTLQAGSVLKFGAGLTLSVSGDLTAQGTVQDPVVFTSLADDSIAGDTNNNGPSTGTPGDWHGLQFTSTSDASSLTRAEVRYAGRNGFPGIGLSAADITLVACVVRDGQNSGLDLAGNVLSFPAVSGCSFVNNAGVAVDDVALATVPGFTNNTAGGNGGNFMRVTFASLGADTVIGPASLLGGALVMATSFTVPAGRTLTLQPGVVLKWQTGTILSDSGALNVLGTGLEPVVFTDFADDTVAGDTNNDGSASAPAAGAWFGVSVAPGAAPSIFDHFVVRYAGRNSLPAFGLQAPALTARALRADFSFGRGIAAAALAGPAHDWVAFRCGGAGIDLTGGAIDVVHATAAHNTGAGIQRSSPHSGTVRNSIAFGSGGANFSGWTAGQVFSSCGGFSGQNGNIVADPLFADPSPAGGDLGLLSGSPCLDTASLPDALPVVMDWRDASRVLDHALTGAMLPDMGAFERAAYTMAVAGVAKLGGTVTLTVSGTAPGFSIYALGGLDGTVLAPPFGFVTCGNLATVLVFPGIVPTGTPFPITVPVVPALVGLSVGLQTLTFDGSGQHGNVTNLYRPVVRP